MRRAGKVPCCLWDITGSVAPPGQAGLGKSVASIFLPGARMEAAVDLLVTTGFVKTLCPWRRRDGAEWTGVGRT